MDILNLPGFKVLKTEENQYDYRTTTELTEKPGCCPHCGSKPNLYLHGSREQLVRDTSIHGKRVGILFLRKRYKCRECGSTFYKSAPAIDKKHVSLRGWLNVFSNRLWASHSFILQKK
ncbi:MAG: transposase family protein [Firmicutes bacterium]|nr:transposase family protein [Bacillota bacterium]